MESTNVKRPLCTNQIGVTHMSFWWLDPEFALFLLFLLTVMWGILLAYAIERKRIDHIPVFVFILALWLTYLLGPLAMVRYAIYLYGMVPLYPALVMSKETED